MKKNIIQICVLMLFVGIVCIPLYVHAGDVNPPCPTGQVCIQNPFNGGNNLTDFITTVLNNVVMPIAAVAAVVYIIWAGFSYVMAQGNEKKIQEAHQRLLWALVGTGVLLGAAGISQVIQTTVKSLLN